MPHHRAVAVVDLAFLAGRCDDQVRLGHPRAAESPHEAAHAGVLGGKAVIVDEIAPVRDALQPRATANSISSRYG
jgi:hypothetical protein